MARSWHKKGMFEIMALIQAFLLLEAKFSAILLYVIGIFITFATKMPRPGLRIDANHIHTQMRINHTAGARAHLGGKCALFVHEVYDWRCKDIKNFNMKIIELLKFNKELLERLKNAGIRMEDCQYVELYSDFETMRKTDSQKVTYIVEKMAEKYDISVRKVYQLIKFFNSDCTPGAVQ